MESASFTVTAGVTWTLQYEWQFYFALPALAIFATNDRLHLPFAVAALFTALAVFFMGGGFQFTLYAFFACGMITASLEAAGYLVKLQMPVLPIMCAGSLLLVPLFYGTAFQPEVVVLLGLSFFFLVSGANLFGLLVARPSILLGKLRYSIYLMQGIVLYCVFAIGPLREFALASDANFWIVIFIVLVELVFMALAMHILVERPGVEFGRKLRGERQDLVDCTWDALDAAFGGRADIRSVSLQLLIQELGSGPINMIEMAPETARRCSACSDPALRRIERYMRSFIPWSMVSSEKSDNFSGPCSEKREGRDLSSGRTVRHLSLRPFRPD